jgi:tryptophan synthase alpha chain
MRLSKKFEELAKKREKALILYISCGDPSVEETIRIAREVIAAGCDILELGLPFSDPIADGPTIQAASQRAIAAGMNTDRYFEVSRQIEGVPKVCMTYYNLIYRYGLVRFARSCAASGITGLIVPDLPPEEAGPLKDACDKNCVDLIYIVSPQTSAKRLRMIRKAMGNCGGFVYLQSVLGVTGARDSMEPDLKGKIGQLKKVFGLPVAVGFGVSTHEQARELAEQGADGIIVGSALVKKIAESQDVAAFVRSLKASTKH